MSEEAYLKELTRTKYVYICDIARNIVTHRDVTTQIIDDIYSIWYNKVFEDEKHKNTYFLLLNEIAACQKTRPETLRHIYNRYDYREDDDTLYMMNLSFAQNPRTPCDILEILAKNPIDTVRIFVAGNTSTFTYIIDMLLRDKDYEVRLAAVNSSNVNIETIRNIANNKCETNFLVRKSIYKTLNISIDRRAEIHRVSLPDIINRLDRYQII